MSRDAFGKHLYPGDYVIASGYWYGSKMCLGKVTEKRGNYVDIRTIHSFHSDRAWKREVRSASTYLVKVNSESFQREIALLEEAINNSLVREERERIERERRLNNVA